MSLISGEPMTRDDIFDQDRGERNYYMTAALDEEVLLPLTRDGFEALLEVVAALSDLPIDDAARSVLAGYVHHIANEQSTSTFKMLNKVLHKSISNATTWRIDQEIKLKRRQEQLEAQAKLATETAAPKEDAQVINIQ